MSAAWIFAAILLTAACFGLVYLFMAAASVLILARRRTPQSAVLPPVTILKPLHGGEPGLFENLASFCAQDYPADVQIVFGVQHPADPALAAVAAIRAAFPGRRIDLVVDGRLHGSNRKVSNLVNMAEMATNEVVVMADSDMAVAPDYLARICSELARPGVGAVTCVYHGRAVGTFWSRLAALGIDTHFLPGVAVGVALGLAKPCLGSTIALRASTLAAIGGFRALADDLADDYVIGERVRALGLDVAVTPFTISHACQERSVADLLRQELRWSRTIRQIDPLGHAGSAVSHPVPLACLALLVEPGALALAVLGLTLAGRVGLCLAVERGFGLSRRPYWLVPARDLLSFCVFLASFCGRGVSWRGRRYDVTPAGVMTSKDEALNPR